MQEVNKTLSPFLDPDSPYFEDAGETRNLTGTCTAHNMKPKKKGKKKTYPPGTKPCSRDKSHKGKHEHWQNGMRIRVWGD